MCLENLPQHGLKWHSCERVFKGELWHKNCGQNKYLPFFPWKQQFCFYFPACTIPHFSKVLIRSVYSYITIILVHHFDFGLSSVHNFTLSQTGQRLKLRSFQISFVMVAQFYYWLFCRILKKQTGEYQGPFINYGEGVYKMGKLRVQYSVCSLPLFCKRGGGISIIRC